MILINSAFSYISDIIQNLSKNKTDLIILIGGLARAGKSTFAAQLSSYLKSIGLETKTLCLDNWILDNDKRLPGMTVRERFDYDNISYSIKNLILDRQISVSNYDPKTKTTYENQMTIKLKKNDILIIEGVVALDIQFLRYVSSFSVFIVIDEDERKERFIKYYMSNGFPLEYTEGLYSERWDNENSIILESQKYADLVVNQNQIIP